MIFENPRLIIAMKLIRKCALILLLPLLAFGTAHKFYLSVTQVVYAPKEESLQITSRIFIDDFEAVLLERYGIATHLATENELDGADDYIEKYLRAKLQLRINGKAQTYRYLGKKYDNDVMVCYLEVEEVPSNTLSSIEIQNEVLTDLFEDQKNLVHILINDLKKSFVLVKDNNKGMLNL